MIVACQIRWLSFSCAGRSLFRYKGAQWSATFLGGSTGFRASACMDHRPQPEQILPLRPPLVRLYWRGWGFHPDAAEFNGPFPKKFVKIPALAHGGLLELACLASKLRGPSTECTDG